MSRIKLYLICTTFVFTLSSTIWAEEKPAETIPDVEASTTDTILEEDLELLDNNITPQSERDKLILGVDVADGEGLKSKQLAYELIDRLSEEDFEAARQNFDEAMLKTYKINNLRRSWIKLKRRVGDFEQKNETRITTTDRYEVVHVNCEFVDDSVEIKVVVDDEKVAGLYFLKS